MTPPPLPVPFHCRRPPRSPLPFSHAAPVNLGRAYFALHPLHVAGEQKEDVHYSIISVLQEGPPNQLSDSVTN